VRVVECEFDSGVVEGAINQFATVVFFVLILFEVEVEWFSKAVAGVFNSIVYLIEISVAEAKDNHGVVFSKKIIKGGCLYTISY
jgi:hypothetical protein